MYEISLSYNLKEKEKKMEGGENQTSSKTRVRFHLLVYQPPDFTVDPKEKGKEGKRETATR